MDENTETTETNEEVADNAETAAAGAESEEQKKKDRHLLNDFLEIVESTIITVFVIVLVVTYFLHPVSVVGTSMINTLHDKDRVLMNTVVFNVNYGDIVVVNNDISYLLDENNNIVKRNIDGSTLKECIIKRVIAVGGQTIDFDPETHDVIVDGKVLDEPYILDKPNSGGTVFNYPITIPEGYYFVMGDNRNGSSDSRVADIGLVKRDQIFGKALVRYFPYSDFKFLINSYKKSNEK